MPATQCRFFNGYKPCVISLKTKVECNTQCPHLETPEQYILLVHLGAMGAVLRSTALLSMIKKKYPTSHITWVTEERCLPLLQNLKSIDKVLTLSARDQLILSGMEFDIGFFIDKSPEMGGIQTLTHIRESYGFGINKKGGAIVPLNSQANELWELGLSNEKKFYENKKTELELIAKALDLPYNEEEYQIVFSDEETQVSQMRKKHWSQDSKYFLIGLNTGTSGYLDKKTIPIAFWNDLIERFRLHKQIRFVLLGGISELEKNKSISSHANQVLLSPHEAGLRDGLCSLNAVDLVVTADSLGMHMSIGLKKTTLVWFGPSCAHEINLYQSGKKIISDFTCAPCWKRTCDVPSPCNENISLNTFFEEISKSFEVWKNHMKKADRITSHRDVSHNVDMSLTSNQSIL